MKPKFSPLIKFLTVCFAPAIASLSFQSAFAATRIWDGGAATNLLNTPGNWSDNTVPNAAGDVAQWNGTVPGPLALTSTDAWTQTGGNAGGTSILVTSGQTGSLTLSPIQNLGLGSTVTVESGAGPVTINPTALLVFRGGNATITNESVNALTFGTSIGNWNNGGGGSRTVTFAGEGNILVNGNFVLGGAGVFDLIKTGSGTLSLNGVQNGGLVGVGNSMATVNIEDGTLRFGNAAQIASAGVLGNYTSNITVDGTLDWSSSASQTLAGVISGGGQIQQSAGNLVLTSLNSFNGSVDITGGTLNVSGGGSLDSNVFVNGPNARFLLTSTVDSLQTISLSQGTVGGTGTLSGINVNDNAGAVVANGNGSGSSGSLTVGTLAFNGDAAINITDDGNTATSGIVVTGTLSTVPTNGTITVNASNTFWNSGVTYNLISAGNFSAAFADFTLGTINGVTGRQAPSLVATANGIGLLISGDNPKWSGLDNNNWVVGSTGPNSNWRLVSQNTPTDYIQGDVVLFDDSATGTTVSISAANVQPAVVNFNNSTKNFALNGPFGISSGVLNKNGTGNVAISSTNTFTGGTNLNAGTITLGGAGTLGGATNALTIAGGTLNLGATSQTVGSLSVTGASTIQNGTLTASGLTVSNPTGTAAITTSLNLGAGGIIKSGAGLLTLSGNTSYSGATTINGGLLSLAGTAALPAAGAVNFGGGSLDLGGKTQTTGAINISGSPQAGDTLANGTISPASFSINTPTETGSLIPVVISANIVGATGVTRNFGGGTITLTGNNTFTGPVNFAGNGTVIIEGGANTGGGAITYNSFGSTFTINDGSYLTSGITSNGYSEFRNLTLNGGTLESQGNIFAPDLAITITLNGGTLKSGNAAGITVYDANNQVAIGTNGAFIDTTTGDITVGLNTGGPAALANPLPRLNGTTGIVSILGGNSLNSGILSTTYVEIQGDSTWNLNGVVSSVGGLSGGGAVTSSPGSAVLTLNMESDETYAGTISGGVSLVKTGTGIQTLSGTISQLGDTTVTAGTLDITANSATTFSDSAIITLNNDGTTTSGVLNLPNNVTDNVAGLVVNGVPLAPNTYDANSPETLGLITGSGKLVVAGGFAGYMAQFTLLSAEERLPNADPDGDGIPNLVEYAVDGLSPIDAENLADAFTDNSLTFNKRGEAIPFVNYGMEVSSDLGLTDPWTVVTLPNPRLIDNADLISYTFNPATDGPRDFVRLKVSEK